MTKQYLEPAEFIGRKFKKAAATFTVAGYAISNGEAYFKGIVETCCTAAELVIKYDSLVRDWREVA